MRYRPEPKKKRWFLKFVIFILIIIICFFVINFYYCKSTLKIAKFDSFTQPNANIVWPSYGSGAIEAVGFDGAAMSYGDANARPIASLTKIITALVVLEKKPLSYGSEGPIINITQSDQDIYNQQIAAGAAAKPVTVGSSMSEKQMIETMILPSAANYSIMLANWAYGSVGEYLKAADSWLVKNNLTLTSVVDTSGLLSENTSNPTDLIKIGKLALENKSLAEIVNMKQAVINDLGKIYNSNSLIGIMGINGIKTGFTGDAGSCILFSSIYRVGGKNITIIGTLLGADGRSQQNNDVKQLLASVQSAFHSVRVIPKNKVVASYRTILGQNVNLVSKENVDEISWSDAPVSVKIDFGAIGSKSEAIVKIGDKISRHQLFIGQSR